ncbi:MAG: SecY-interacting protein Syd, partial [Plesiomonas shigelloides]
WSRLQENLIGHLVAQRQRKCTPTLFVALTDDDNQIVSVCNLTGAVVLERLGSSEHTVLADNLVAFLGGLQPRIAEL